MKRFLISVALMAALPAMAQTDWKKIEKLIEEDSYKSAYEEAEKVFRKTKNSNDLLTAAWYMSEAAEGYQEDCYDSAVARYRSILPRLEAPERAVCYAILSVPDSALLDEELLKKTPSDRIKQFCDEYDPQDKPDSKAVIFTPTVFDVVMLYVISQKYEEKQDEAIALLQKLIDFHKDDNDNLRIHWDLEMLGFLEDRDYANRPYDEHLIQSYINKYRGSSSPMVAKLYSCMANHFYAHNRLVEAVRYCDTAVALFPKSNDGALCADLRNRILAPSISVDDDQYPVVLPGRPSIKCVGYKNLSRLHFFICSYDREDENYFDHLPKPLHQWVLDVKDDGSHLFQKLYVDLPALPMGSYMLFVSPDATMDRRDAYQVLNCVDYQLNHLSPFVFQLFDSRSGKPIEGQMLELKKRREVIDSLVTDADGRAHYLGSEGWFNIQVTRGGQRFLHYQSWGYTAADPKMEPSAQLVVDRPIYRPGDTVFFSAVLYESDEFKGWVLVGRKGKFRLENPNGKRVAWKEFVTDSGGFASDFFVLPPDGLAGCWTLDVASGKTTMTKSLLVEEYKQPKFMVSLDEREQSVAQVPQFGEPYTVHGLARAYSGTNIIGAQVKYTVMRHSFTRQWWKKIIRAQVAEGTVTTASDGSFEFSFVPWPDSTFSPTLKPNFEYSVFVEVTDLNGETHNANASFFIGYQNMDLSLLSGAKELNVSDFSTLGYELADLSLHPVEGDVEICLERLHLPDTPRLLLPLMRSEPDSIPMTLTRQEFERKFPQYCYSKRDVSPLYWTTDWRWNTTHHSDGKHVKQSVDLPELASGYYRVVARIDDLADTSYVILTRPAERRVQSIDLFWADLDCQEAEVGSWVTLRYGSRFKDVPVFCIVSGYSGKEISSRWLPAGETIKKISFPVDSAMLGGFNITLLAVKDGITHYFTHKVAVPFSHKKLKVDIATFRDKLQPGEQEEWTIKVSSPQPLSTKHKTLTTSTLTLSMFDDALSEYSHFDQWSFNPWRNTSDVNVCWLLIYGKKSSYFDENTPVKGSDPDYIVWTLSSLDNPGYYHRGRYLSRKFNAEEVVFSAEVATDGGTARGEGGMVTMQGNVRKRTGVNMKNAEIIPTGLSEMVETEEVVSDAIPLRTNLSTLAFFAPALRTDSTGTVTYRFRLPDLLTRWRVKGLAVSPDLKIGTLDRTLVTQKPLMVQPNIPRFLRHGDSFVLMAKVMNLTDDERKVHVNFSLRDASQDTQNIPNILHNQNTQIVTVPAQGSAQVTFPIQVPNNVYVATYQMTAVAKNMSDGERGQIPVVSNRQAVTLSQPVYINGAGEKTFNFRLSPLTSTAEPHFLGAELVSNPVWLAIKSMPYLKQQENPSTLYLANSLYVNTLANEILKDFKGLRNIKVLTDTANTRLKINEDVKQTLLEATPWLRDAESEVEQRQAIANYFDSIRLSEEFSKLNAQLTSRQNSDGGWSWMPDGESSTWVTMQVLKRVTKWQSDQVAKSSQTLSHSVTRALQYIDREEQRHYEKYIKPYLKKYKWSPDNIDYLYTRSFYGKGNTEAYKFYYNNALKNYKNYNGLYIQAQLALIFQRHGDKQAARDLIRRLKEKALENDEMGMYWRDNRSGWCWYERPIETQALLIQAFREVTPQDTLSIALMQQWLLKQKQTTHWGNDRATVEAISALVTPENPNTPSNPNTLNNLKSTTLTLCGVDLSTPSEGLEGYRTQRWEGPALDSIIALEDSTVTLRKVTPGIAWGAVYYQYTDDMDKIPSSESGITLKRCYLNQNNQNIQSTLNTLKVGDRVKVRIDISCDRTMEYLELIDGRPSCVEPLSTRAGWNWNQGLRYYVEVKNTATHCYINRLEKGKYVVEYDVYVTNPGTFLAGPVTMQCMYAPEFRAIAPATRLEVEK